YLKQPPAFASTTQQRRYELRHRFLRSTTCLPSSNPRSLAKIPCRSWSRGRRNTPPSREKRSRRRTRRPMARQVAQSAQIAFDRSLYILEAVEAGVAAYADHAQIVLTPSADAIVADISEREGGDVEDIAKAFCNHVLFETIARLRQAALREVA